MDWPIQRVAELTGVTSRTLRHYDSIGLLIPTRIGRNGYRYYDERALVRLQRILLLRNLGLALSAISQVLDGQRDDIDALTEHVAHLGRERARLDEQIHSVTATIAALQRGTPMNAADMFAGFDYRSHRDEVAERWGTQTAERAEQWWEGLDDTGRHDFLGEHRLLQDAYDAAQHAGEAPGSATVQQLAARHYDWIVRSWQGTRPTAAELRGLAEMYVADTRFAANYTRIHPGGAEFVRDALLVFAAARLD